MVFWVWLMKVGIGAPLVLVCWVTSATSLRKAETEPFTCQDYIDTLNVFSSPVAGVTPCTSGNHNPSG